jgi:SAM-dependent methyltransferase
MRIAASPEQHLQTARMRHAASTAVGLDPEPEMLAKARLQAVREGVANVVWMEAGSEDLGALRPGLGCFRLVTMGNSFQWMDRARTLHALAGLLVLGGGIVVAADGRPAGTVPHARPTWNAAVHRVLHRRLGDTRRADGAAGAHPGEPDEAVIRRAGLTRIETYRHVYHSRRDVEHIIGYLSSTSFAAAAVLGAQQQRHAATHRSAGVIRRRRSLATRCRTIEEWRPMLAVRGRPMSAPHMLVTVDRSGDICTPVHKALSSCTRVIVRY